MAPSVVASSLKTSILTSYMLENMGYQISLKYNATHADIVCAITFNDPELLIKYVQGIQAASPKDASAVPEPWDMPGYDDKVIMASG